MDGRGVGSVEEPLPWLEAVEDEDEPRGLSARKMLAAIAVVLAAAALVAGTLFWLGRSAAPVGSGPPELIKAEPGPYKVKPENPGGLNVAGDSETAFATSAGEETEAELDLGAVPEQPVARPEPKPQVPAAPVETPAKKLPGNETKVPVREEVEAAPSGGSGSVIQLGAYANQAQAEAAWKALSGRFSSLASLNKIVVPYKTDNSSGYRLRAGAPSSADAQRTCQLLRVAGENCFVVR